MKRVETIEQQVKVTYVSDDGNFSSDNIEQVEAYEYKAELRAKVEQYKVTDFEVASWNYGCFLHETFLDEVYKVKDMEDFTALIIALCRLHNCFCSPSIPRMYFANVTTPHSNYFVFSLNYKWKNSEGKCNLCPYLLEELQESLESKYRAADEGCRVIHRLTEQFVKND